MTTNIFLIGMPSSGKSTLGKQLAKLLNYEFVDLDIRIELAEGLKVPEIFSMKGEEYFRKSESQQLKKIQKDSKVIVATGGGVPCFFDNMDYIKDTGVSIFLNVEPEKLIDRVKSSKKNDRPLLDIESETLETRITDLYNKRLPDYKKADIIIEGDTDADNILWILEAEFSRLSK